MLAAALSLLALAPGPADEVVARADGQAVVAADVAARLGQGADARRARAVLEELVGEALLAAESERLGLDGEGAVQAEVEGHRRRLAAERFEEREIGALEPSEEDLRSLYHARSDQVRLRIAVYPTRQEAAEGLSRIQRDGDFAGEARRSLEPRTAGKGGDRGLEARGQLEPALEKAAFGAPLRSLQGPVPLQVGFAVFEVTERHVADEAGFRSEREALSRFAARQLAAQARSHLLQQLRRQAGVALDEPFLRSLGTRVEPTAAEEAHPVATLGERPLRYGDILPRIRRLSRGMEQSHSSGPGVKIQVAWGEIDRLLLEGAAMKRGYGDDPEVKRRLVPRRRDALTRMLATRIRSAVAAPSKAEVEAEYGRRLAELTRPGRRSCAHILVATREEAAAARGRLKGGEAFEDLARALSRDGTAERGGLIGDIADDKLEVYGRPEGEPALASAFRSLAPGEVSQPVRSRAGWHLVRCGPHLSAGPAPLGEVSGSLAQRMLAERGDEAVKRRVAELRAGARVAVDEQALARATRKD